MAALLGRVWLDLLRCSTSPVHEATEVVSERVRSTILDDLGHESGVAEKINLTTGCSSQLAVWCAAW